MVSFVVPVFNGEAFLEECIESVLSQTHPDLELILVDDGSFDSTPRICDEAADADSRVKVIHTANRGVSAARNTGVQAATGTLVVFVDADDTIHPQFSERMQTMMSDSGAEAAICRFATGNNTFTKTEKGTNPAPKPDFKTLDTDTLIRRILYQDGFDSSLCGKLLPREALLHAPFDENTRYEDLDAFHRIYKAIGANAKIASTRQRLYFYRNNPHSYIHTFTPARLDVLDVTRRILDAYKDDTLLAEAARSRRFSAAYNMFILCSRAGLDKEADKCWQLIREFRNAELRDPRVRFKNKAGAMLSHLGRRFTLAVSHLLY